MLKIKDSVDLNRIKEKLNNMLQPPLPFIDDDLTGQEIKALWDILNKIENKTLIELPCKVGDTFWEVNTLFQEVTEVKARDICTIIRWKEIKAFGRWLFNTKAEAEAKLEELMGKL